MFGPCSDECTREARVDRRAMSRYLSRPVVPCVVCGKSITRYNGNGNLCSDECRKKRRRLQDEERVKKRRLSRQRKRECEECKKVFISTDWRVVTCSLECRRLRKNRLQVKKFHSDPQVKKRKLLKERQNRGLVQIEKRCSECQRVFFTWNSHYKTCGEECRRERRIRRRREERRSRALP